MPRGAQLRMTLKQSTLDVRVQPKAKQNSIDVLKDGTVRIRVTAAPERGKANYAVIQVLAKRLGVARSTITVRRGTTSRLKTLHIEGLDAEEVYERLRH